MRRWSGVAGFLAACSASVLAEVYQAGDWPIDVSVAADQPAIMVGEPVWLSFTVTNLSEQPLQILVGGDYQNDLGRPDSFTIRAVRDDGKWADLTEGGEGKGGLIGPKDLPPGGAYTFRLFLPHWVTFKEPGAYRVICRRTLQLLQPAPDGAFTKQPTRDIAVDVRTRIEVQPRDTARMKNVIERFGERMLEANGEAPGDEAVVALAWIDDPRVVPYFARALRIRSYALRFIAVQMLGRHATEEAIAALKAALGLQAADFDGVSPEKSADLAARIRAAAVSSLSRFRHPQAAELVAAQHRDPSARVRMSVVQALPRLSRNQALPLLRELTRDSDEAVRTEAARQLATLQPAARPADRK